MPKVSLALLSEMASKCGLSRTGTKQSLSHSILSKAFIEPSYHSICSIDIGTRELAYVELDLKCDYWYKVNRWKVSSLDLPKSYHPTVYATILRDYLLKEGLLQKEARPSIDHSTDCWFLLERQRTRSFGHPAISESFLKVLFVEVQLHSLLLDRCKSIDPRAVGRYFDLGCGKEKKKHAVKLIDQVIVKAAHNESNVKDHAIKEENRKDNVPLSWKDRLIFEKHHVAMWQEAKASSKDDLADCLLQGVAYFDWRLNALDFASRLSQDAAIIQKNG